MELKDEGKCTDTANHSMWNLRTKQEQFLDKGYIPLCSLRVMVPSILLFSHPFSPDITEYKTVLDFGLHAKDSGFQEPASDFMSVELGFCIPVVSGIPDSFSCIPYSKAKNSSNSTSKNFPDSGFPHMGRPSHIWRTGYTEQN